jgi:predicted permease
VSTNPVDALRQQSRGSTGPRTLMHTLVIGEVALAAVLLLASALMADNLVRLTQADLGLNANGLSAVELTLPEVRYNTPEQRRTVVRELLQAAHALPGIDSAGIVTVNPLERGSFGAAVETEDRPLAPREAGHIVNNRLVSHDWLTASGISLVRGRYFDGTDDERAPLVVIVSERMASRLWPGVDPIGKRIRLTRPGSPWMTVVGIVDDVRDFGEWRETWYLPYWQHAQTFGTNTVHLMLRSPLALDAIAGSLRAAVQRIDPHLPVPMPTAMTAMWDATLEQQRLAAAASRLFGVSGLLLAVIGTYGVLAYVVSARQREIGIRLALGAERTTVLLEVVRRGTLLAGAGLAVGASAGLLVNRALAVVAAESPGTPVASVLTMLGLLTASAIAASLVPALRATRVDPANVMRVE